MTNLYNECIGCAPHHDKRLNLEKYIGPCVCRCHKGDEPYKIR